MRSGTMEETNPLISVIVPVYNVEDDLDRCVRSLVGQTYSNLEILLVDDGSEDSSGILCDQWAREDGRIRVIHKQNGGLSSARNAGIEAADGSYLGFVDSDDYVDSNMYKEMLSCFTGKEISLVCCGRFVHIGADQKEEFSSDLRKIFDKESLFKEIFLGNLVDVSACDKLYRRSLFSDLRYPEGRISEDAAVILKLVDNVDQAVHVGKSFYHYVFRAGSISKVSYSHRKYDVMTNCVEMREWVRHRHPALMEYLNSYCCSQMAGVLQSMYHSPGALREWRNDYREYRLLFNECFGDYLKVGCHRKNELVRIVATRAHLYWAFRLIRLVKRKVKRNGD